MILKETLTEIGKLAMFVSICLLLVSLNIRLDTLGIKLDIIAMNQRAQMQLTIQEKR